MVDIKYLIRHILRLMKIRKYKQIPITNSKKILDSYQLYWAKLMSLIASDISRIIHG